MFYVLCIKVQFISSGKFCGTQIPHPITSFSNALVVNFNSDSSVTKKGFRATYAASTSSRLRSLLKFITAQTSLQFFSYAASHPSSLPLPLFSSPPLSSPLFCSFLFSPPLLSSPLYAVGSLGSVSQAVVAISTWSLVPSTVPTSRMRIPPALSVCGRSTALLATGCSCPSRELLPLTSPQHFISCHLIGQFRNLTFSSLAVRLFQLQASPSCNSDYVEIREANSTGPLIGRFCGNSLPSNYTSVFGHVLWVKFVSDASVSGAGFRATFSLCEDTSESSWMDGWMDG